MYDAIEFEKRGVPAAVICTEPFISSAKAMSSIAGIPGYPCVILEHPLGSLPPEILKERAMQASPEILRILLSKS